jgi:hypothetical protein
MRNRLRPGRTRPASTGRIRRRLLEWARMGTSGVKGDAIPEFGVRVMGASYLDRPGAYALIRGNENRLALVLAKAGRLFLPGGGIRAGEGGGCADAGGNRGTWMERSHPRSYRARYPIAPSTWHLQIDGKRDGLSDAGDTRDYAAIATPMTSAQVAKAWVRS